MNRFCPAAAIAAMVGCRLRGFTAAENRSHDRGAWGIVLAAMVVAAAPLVSVPTAHGQNFMVNPMSPEGRFIAPPRSIRQTLTDAERAIQNERYSDAVLGLGDLLAREPVAEDDADLAGQDFFLDAGEGTKRAEESLFREAEAMLGRMPAAGLETYELRHGPKAARLAEQAAAAQDRNALRDVSRRFFHTAAGYEATLLLGYLELTEGRPVAAAAVLRRLARQPRAAARFGDALQLTLAEAEHLAGIHQSRTGPRGGQPTGVLRGKVAGTPVEMPAGNAEAEWLESTFGFLQAVPPEAADQTMVAGGGVSRWGGGGGHLPLSGVRWMLPTTSSQRQERALDEFIDAADNSSEVPAPSWQPIVANGQLLMRTSERMVAVDFETGKRIWEYPWSGDAGGFEEGVLDVEQMDNEDAARDFLIQRVWNDLPYGRISSDGARVYLLADLGELEMTAGGQGMAGMPAGIRRRVRGGAMRPADGGSNTLVALDLKTEGKLLWMRGQQGDEPAENDLSEAFFLGPPLPIEGSLYQMAEVSGDTYLLCLDPATGRERWRQQLMANEGGSIATDPLRRIGGAMPAYRDGILVCPTAAGAVVAVDLVSRTLLWGNHFPRSANQPGFRRGGRGRSEQTLLLRRWLDGTPIIADGCVLVSPVESDQLYGFDLLTGRPLWSPIPREDYRYVAGVRGGQFLLVSTNRVQAFDLRSGEPTWSVPMTLTNEERVAGTGVFGDGVYLLPTTARRIVEIDLERGQVLRRRKTDFPLGNLLAAGDSLISQDATTLAVAYGEEPLMPVVEERLSSDANDLWAMLRRGELLLQQGERSEAIHWLLKARRQDPTDEEVRVLLVDALLASIRQGETPDPEAADLLDDLVELTPQRVELLRLQVDNAIRDGAPEAALEHLITLSQIVLREEQTMRARQPRQIQVEENLRTSLDSWIAARLAMALETSDEEQREAIDEKIAAHVAPLQTETPSVRRRLLTQFGRSPTTDTLRSGLYTTAVEGGLLVEAERWALDALVAGDTEAAPQRRLHWQRKLADLYTRTGFGEDAQQILEKMAAEGAEGDADEELRQRTAELTAPHDWPQGVRLRARDDVMRQRMQNNRRLPIDVVSRRGRTFAGWLPQIDQNGAIVIRDPQGRDHMIQFDGGRMEKDLTQATIDHGLMILLTPQELVGIDLFALGQGTTIDAVLWRRPWRMQTGSNTARSRSAPEFLGDNRKNYVFTTGRPGSEGEGVVRLGPIVGRHFFLLQGHEVIALDVVTNEELWRSGGYADDAYVVANDDHVAVVSVHDGVQLLRSEDGGRVRHEAWEPSERIHLAAGRHLLTSRNESSSGGRPARRVVRLRDPIAGEEVLSAALESPEGSETPDAYARILDGRLMTVLTAEGRALVWDLFEGRQIADAEVDTGGQLSGIQSLLWNDSVLIGATRRDDRTTGRPKAANPQTGWGEDHVETDGPVHAISLDDGSVRWSYELEGAWGVTRTQPGGSPLLILTRATRAYPDVGKPVKRMDLLAIDTRDGSTAYRVDAMDVESNFNEISTEAIINPAEETVDVRVSRYGFLFEFVDQALSEDERTIGTEAIAEQIEQSRAGRDSGPAINDVFEAPQRPPIPVR